MGVIEADALIAKLSSVRVVIPTPRSARNGAIPKSSAAEIVGNFRKEISLGTLQRLCADNATGDRSKVLWRLYGDLLEAGLSAGEVLVVVERTPWNKFGEDRNRLWADINAAVQHQANGGRLQSDDTRRVGRKGGEALGTGDEGRAQRNGRWAEPVSAFLARERQDPKWMIEGLWSDKSHGIVAGEPKTRKSYLAIDIAVSVATATPALGYFPVSKPSPVLMIQEEVSDSEMSKRLRWIIASKGLGGAAEKGEDGTISVQLPHEIDLHLRNRKGFDLSDTEHLQVMTNFISHNEVKLVILDPLQMMLGSIDENRTSEVRPILRNLLLFKEATGCGVMILHHYNKGQDRSGGQRMSGTHAFHGWVESALYLAKPEPYVTHVDREFRNFEPFSGFDVEFVGDEEYEVVVTEHKQKRPDKLNDLELFVAKHPDGVSIIVASKELGVTRDTILRHTEKSERISVKNVKGKTGRPVRKLFLNPSN